MSGPGVESPCIRHCTLGTDDVCVGCFRHLDEITGWMAMTDAERRSVLERAAARQADYEARRKGVRHDANRNPPD